MDTITQVCTPLGTGGIIVLRISGENALSIALKKFSAKNLTSQNITPNFLNLGLFKEENFVEKCFMAYFKAPKSFTGEDVVEFQIHGSEFLANKMLESIVSCGARLAENGEFTKRAFLNGKMTLSDAESMIDLIHSQSEAELKANSVLASNRLNKKVEDMQNQITDALANIAVCIDYPEYEQDEEELAKTSTLLNNLKQEIEKLVQTFSCGAIIKNGIDVAIVGKPNVGKSSLLNSLVQQNRAIVTNIKGTTRDTVCETILHSGIKINLIDTAGIRESTDEVERIGIEKSKDALEKSHIILCLLDASEELEQEDKDLIEICKNKNTIFVHNKSDIAKFNHVDGSICISAKNEDNIEQLKDLIVKKVKADKIDFSSVVLTNARHKEALLQAKQQIEEISQNEEIDLVDTKLKRLWKTLGKITGTSETEQIISAVFSKFCLGK